MTDVLITAGCVSIMRGVSRRIGFENTVVHRLVSHMDNGFFLPVYLHDVTLYGTKVESREDA